MKLEKAFELRDFVTFTCGHMENKMQEVTTMEEISEFYDKNKAMRRERCEKCKAIDKEYNMVRMVEGGEFDGREVNYFFKTQDIKSVIRYCWKNNIPLHDEHFNTGCGRDCTGQLCDIYASVKRKMGYIIVRNSFRYDY